MALARVVSFDGVSSDHMAEMTARMQNDDPPEGLDVTEMLLLHDPDSEQALAVLVFADEDAYRSGDAILDAMPAGDTPGRRDAVRKYTVAWRMAR